MDEMGQDAFPDAISIFGVNPKNPRREPVVVVAMMKDGEMVEGLTLLCPPAYARQIAARLVQEADAVDAGLRMDPTASKWSQ